MPSSRATMLAMSLVASACGGDDRIARRPGVLLEGFVSGHARSRHRRLWASFGACLALPRTVSPMGHIGRRAAAFSRPVTHRAVRGGMAR